MILNTLDIDTLETKTQPTRTPPPPSGYGRKIATDTLVRYEGKWRRVYACVKGNAGTCYITAGPNHKDWIVIN